MNDQRRLAAILVADVVGYSKHLGSDEAATLAKFSALKHDVIEPAIAKHTGRLFKSVGDGFLVEFASADEDQSICGLQPGPSRRRPLQDNELLPRIEDLSFALGLRSTQPRQQCRPIS